jgi:cytoskeletal protein CcmA (bactofilin family)
MFEKRRDTNQDGPKAHFDAGLSDLTQSKNAPASGRTAVIGPRIRINGDVSGDENLVIEGQVQGKVQLDDHRVDIGTSGKVHADISAKIVKIDGEVRGDISGHEKVIISRSGNVQGNIVAPRLTLEDGAKFKGSIDMDPSVPEPKATKPAKPAAKPEAKPAAAAVKPATAPAKPMEKPPVKAGGNGQGHIPSKAKKEPGLELKSE